MVTVGPWGGLQMIRNHTVYTWLHLSCSCCLPSQARPGRSKAVLSSGHHIAQHHMCAPHIVCLALPSPLPLHPASYLIILHPSHGILNQAALPNHPASPTLILHPQPSPCILSSHHLASFLTITCIHPIILPFPIIILQMSQPTTWTWRHVCGWRSTSRGSSASSS
jgi:hypothetical protein